MFVIALSLPVTKKQVRESKVHPTNEEEKDQPVINTRGGSASENEVEWKLASAGIWGWEVPRNCKGKTSFRQLEALLCAVLLTACFSIPRDSICSSDTLGARKDGVRY